MTENRFVKVIQDRLQNCRHELNAQWISQKSIQTRYFVLDDLLDAKDAQQIFNAFPVDSAELHRQQSFRERKRTLTALGKQNPILSAITLAFQDPSVVGEISEICSLKGLEADPTLYAGGLSMMSAGDFLNPHIDNSHDGNRSRYRRLNLLFYVTPEWQLDYGGNLELWNPSVEESVTIWSKFNRLVVMETNRESWHSVSPVNCDYFRCCVSNYFFSSDSPCLGEYFHVTSFTGRPEQPFRKMIGAVDNMARNLVAKMLGVGRGRKRINKL